MRRMESEYHAFMRATIGTLLFIRAARDVSDDTCEISIARIDTQAHTTVRGGREVNQIVHCLGRCGTAQRDAPTARRV